MIEEVLVTARYNAKVDPFLTIWSWEVTVYLFLGGLTAGIMVFSALVHLLKKQTRLHFAACQLPLWAPIVLSIGMTTLFLDLEHKLYVFRFYTTLQPTSPMSWGSWILLLVYPITILMILATFRSGYPSLAARLEKLPMVTLLFDQSQKHMRAIAFMSVPTGVALGIYTGVLLSTFSARPIWNTSILCALFLVSGISSAAALIAISSRHIHERHLFSRLDAGIITVELLLIGILIIGLSTGGRVQLDALKLIMGGEYTVAFWGFFVFLGLIVPLMLEMWQMRYGRVLVMLAPLLVMTGGYMLRHVTLEVGQVSTWSNYTIQFEPTLMERLH
ncbi:MAG: polysulfide reductase [Gammaproteobacteria bacterium]|nr:MAG: polysulfide reductase [Gammaproteobacteria bacterium]